MREVLSTWTHLSNGALEMDDQSPCALGGGGDTEMLAPQFFGMPPTPSLQYPQGAGVDVTTISKKRDGREDGGTVDRPSQIN